MNSQRFNYNQLSKAAKKLWNSDDLQFQTIVIALKNTLIILCIISIYLSWFYSFGTRLQGTNWALYIKDMLLLWGGICASVVAAATYEIMARTRTEALKQGEIQAFIDLFKCLEVNPRSDSDVVIILPGYKRNIDPQIPKNIMVNNYKEVYCNDIGYNAQVYSAISDAKATSRIVALFSNMGLPIPKIRSHDDPELDALLSESSSKIKTIISIGLYSNRFLMETCKEKATGRHFEALLKAETNGVRHRLQLKNPNQSAVGDTWGGETFIESVQTQTQQTPPKHTKDWALIAKSCYNAKTVISVGGTIEMGTEAISSWLKRYWRSIPEWADSNSGTRVGSNSFAAILPVDSMKSPKVDPTFKYVRVGGPNS